MSDQNLDKALNLKKEGNESYKANNFEAAIAKYNEAIGKEAREICHFMPIIT